jgi:acetyl-CoA carboxylase biotin carboxyl carrier protein
MGKDVSDSGGSFDLEKLQELIELMEKHGLSDVSLRRGDEHWRLRRGTPQVESVQLVPQAAPAPAPVSAAAPAPAEPAAEDTGGAMIKSPTVGTFYTSPTPDDPPFVSVGTKVQQDTVVCLVEAMKVFNQIPAETNGTIVEVLVNNGDAVEFDQPLFRVQLG